MRSKIMLLLIFFHLCGGFSLHAQEENTYSRETVVGVNLNTNAGLIGGVLFRHTRELGYGRYVNFGAEWVNVKHPNEVRVSNNSSGGVFLFGKKNYLFALRPNVGYEFVLFTKGKEDGIQVDALINGGLSLGFLKPYYVQLDNGTTVVAVPYDSKYYDPSKNLGNIVGSAGFIYGLDKIKLVPGFHVKTGLSFEFGAFGSGVSGIEAGTLIEAYPKRIDLLDVSPLYPTFNRWLFTSLYVNIYFGGRR